MLGGHHAHHDSCSLQRLREITVGRDASRNVLARKKLLIDMLALDGLVNTFFVSPQPHPVGSLASQNNRQSRTPGSRADNCDLAHARFAPMRLSVPASRRRMFS